MLARARVAARLPAQDLERARAFYAEKLGLEPGEERPGGLRYLFGSGEFALFQSAGMPSGEHTQLAFEVEDIELAVAELRRRGVVFEDYDAPGFDHRRTPTSTGTTRARAARAGRMVRDSEGNLLGVGQPVTWARGTQL